MYYYIDRKKSFNRKVVDYNEITEHFLSTIQETLYQSRRVKEIANKPENVEWAKKELCKGAIRRVLRSQQMEIGLTSRKICMEVEVSNRSEVPTILCGCFFSHTLYIRHLVAEYLSCN